MSVCVIGAGLAGLATAVRIKLADRGIEVIVIDSRSGNNTKMAGQRFRSRMSGASDVNRDRLAGLLASRNGGVVTAPMREFARIGRSLGVEFVTGEVVDLHREGNRVTGRTLHAPGQKLISGSIFRRRKLRISAH